MATIGMVVHQENPQAGELAVVMGTWLTAEGHAVRVPASDARRPELTPWACPADQFVAGLDLVVSVGGDGTMLRAVHASVARGVPVLGVNLGRLGYLSEVEPGGWHEALRRFLANDFRVEERMTLDVELHRDRSGETTTHRAALNDAVLEKVETGHTVRVGVQIDGHPFLSYDADGLIVATPTGSTAYNLSAGGPIMSPALSALVVTPVAPHLLFDRSMVLAAGEFVRLEVLDGDAALSVDGQTLGRLASGDFLICRAGPHAARLVSLGERDFRQILKAKFGLSER